MSSREYLSLFVTVFMVGSLILQVGCSSTGASTHIKNTTREVVIYRQDGSQVTGVLMSKDAKGYQLKAADGVIHVPQKRYQGMVLNTTEEKAAADRISTDIIAFMGAAKYAHGLRGQIRDLIKAPSDSCIQKSAPITHFQVLKDGKIENIALLLSSGCKALDKAVLTAVQRVKAAPLPNDYPMAMFPANFVYEPSVETKSEGEQASEQKGTDETEPKKP
jgi:TonB family protein